MVYCPNLDLFEREEMLLGITPGKQVSHTNQDEGSPFIMDQWPGSVILIAKMLLFSISSFSFWLIMSHLLIPVIQLAFLPLNYTPSIFVMHYCQGDLSEAQLQLCLDLENLQWFTIVYMVEFRLLKLTFHYDQDFAPLCFLALCSTTALVPQYALRFPDCSSALNSSSFLYSLI